jgi:hypothetical protein
MTRDFQIRTGPLQLEATSAPLALPLALAALPRQPELAAPAKLVLLRGGEAALMAEIPRALSPAAGEALALRALETGRRWLDEDTTARGTTAGAARRPRAKGAGGGARGDANDRGNGNAGGNGNGMAREPVEQVLGELAWSWRLLENGGYRVDVGGPNGSFRVQIDALPAPDGGLHLTTSAAVQVEAPDAKRAIPHFALESNRRLRLARLCVTATGAERARAVWEVVLPAPLPLERTLRGALDALVGARVSTARALGALGDPQVAGAYLQMLQAHEGEARPRPDAAA